jgi:hypothetical protein
VNAIVEAELFLDMERNVFAFFMFVSDDIVGARNNASGTSGAEPGGNNLFVEFFPLSCPARCF